MDFSNFGREQLQSGKLNGMLEQVGIDDVGSFVNQFRNQANNASASNSGGSADFMSMGSSFLNQV